MARTGKASARKSSPRRTTAKKRKTAPDHTAKKGIEAHKALEVLATPPLDAVLDEHRLRGLDRHKHAPFLDIAIGQVRYWPSNLVETHGGGVAETVKGFSLNRALAQDMGATHLRKADLPAPTIKGRPTYRGGELQRLANRMRPESVVNTDDRVPVATTASVPWRSICYLKIRYERGGTAIGTGFFIGPRTVATAGHNVIREGQGKASRIEVIPGLNQRAAPFGVHLATGIDYHPNWPRSWQPEFDFGCVYLSETVGSRTGWMGYASLDDTAMASVASAFLNNAGYDDDKAPLGTQWYNGGRLATGGVQPAWLQYLIDTEAGQSGSPVFHSNPSGVRTVLAIHVYGDQGRNLGLRITPEVYSFLRRWSAK